MLKCEVCFANSNGNVNWQGRQIYSIDEFHEYLSGPVRSRVIDESNQQSFEYDLRALCTTDMASETLTKLLSNEENDREPWEIGEALAECILEEEFDVRWPWNEERDKKQKEQVSLVQIWLDLLIIMVMQN